MGYRLAKICSCFAVMILCGGCGKEAPPPIVPARGIVLLRGQPLPSAQVCFIPHIDQGTGYIAIGVTDAQGRYTLECNGQSGACAGENTVTVSEGPVPQKLMSEEAQRELIAYRRSLKNRPIPRKYASPVNTPLKIAVDEGQADYNLELSR